MSRTFKPDKVVLVEGCYRVRRGPLRWLLGKLPPGGVEQTDRKGRYTAVDPDGAGGFVVTHGHDFARHIKSVTFSGSSFEEEDGDG